MGWNLPRWATALIYAVVFVVFVLMGLATKTPLVLDVGIGLIAVGVAGRMLQS